MSPVNDRLRRYYWDRATWGDIPPAAWHPSIPPQPAILAGNMPISSTLCRGCNRPMAQALVDMGEEYHVDCGPDRRPGYRVVQ